MRMCKKHNPMNKKLGYVDMNEWAEKKLKQGTKQYKCPDCKKWFFKCEL